MLMFLATLVALGFAATAGAFLTLVWRLSSSVRDYVATEVQRAKYEERIVAMLEQHIETQRETNEQLWMALEINADRFNRWSEKRRRGAPEG